MNLIKMVIIVTMLSGCAYAPAKVDYRNFKMYSSQNTGNMKYEEIMPIQASSSGYAWDSCDLIASSAASQLYDHAISLGANALMNVRWESKYGFTSSPTCVKKYGWFLLYIVGGLGPWVGSATVDASAVKVNENDLKNVSNLIPLKSKKEFISFLHN